jgi:hypothetical protein
MIDEDCRKIGIITFSVAVDNPFPAIGGMFEKYEDQDITGEDTFRSISVKVFHNNKAGYSL